MKNIIVAIISLITIGFLIYFYDWKLALIIFVLQYCHNLEKHYPEKKKDRSDKIKKILSGNLKK